MKRILFVMMSLQSGGAEKSLVNLLNEMNPQKYEIDLLLFRKTGTFLSQVPSYVHICNIPAEINKLYGNMSQAGNLLGTKIIGTLAAKVHESTPGARAGYRWEHYYTKKIPMLTKQYDVAFAYITGETMFYTVEKVQANRKICFVHNDYKTANHPKKYDYRYFEKLDGIASISKLCCDVLEEEFPEFSDKIWCIENITSSAVIKKRAVEFVPKEITGTNNILSVGRLMSQKGFDLAISAASILKKRNMDFHWYIVGDGELRKDLENQIENEGLQSEFTILGIKENPYPYIKACTIFAQTSRYEGKSVVLDEAKILAKPIVVTNYATVNDQIIDRREGIVVDMTPEGIANGIAELLGNKQLRKSLENYLSLHEYGNQREIEKYYKYIEGKRGC
ncbi:glycosyltransferase [Holdemanella porci]|uniref:glycosyltransferase n=1 Tax=Holdemanella porci TaxID=2652276 RepID=UPI003F91B640